ncbi:hypothetical protein J437_LFUL010955 [Ladona fulva]|uniref:Peptidase A2 domain-containing protein n=1 Tax=Ladona fulva TaxID=123851 RepID=A0A8K0P6M4_LADFU|nr:hypothetical protein J437_LFUL010955 [Ladona fulva]
MLVDTGASVTLINEKIADRQKIKPIKSRRNVILKTVTRETSPIRHECQLDIRLGEKRKVQRVYVAKMMDDCIVRLDFLRKNECVLDINRNSLCFKDREEALADNKEELSISNCILRATEAVDILPDSEAEIPVNAEV